MRRGKRKDKIETKRKTKDTWWGKREKENMTRRYFFIIRVTSFSVLEYRISNAKENIKIRF